LKHLKVINKYFWKYRTRLFLGIIFIVLSNYFKILSPQVSGYVIDKVEQAISSNSSTVIRSRHQKNYDVLVKQLVNSAETGIDSFNKSVILFAGTLLALALLSGFSCF